MFETLPRGITGPTVVQIYSMHHNVLFTLITVLHIKQLTKY